MDNAEIMIKEYETLRQEILATIDSRNSILNYGLASIAAIFTASVFTQNSASILSNLILILAVPSLSCFIIYIWLGEYQRMQRAGKFLVGLEQRINQEKAAELLTWETELRKGRKHMKYPYNTTVLLLLVISFVSYSIGMISSGLAYWLSGVLILVGGLAHLVVYLNAVQRIARLRQ